MQFYHVDDAYNSYLRKFDDKVSENKKEKRPYVGIVFEIAGIKYYAPFTSPKPKHRTMKNGKDFLKIKDGIYGAINFNNMIPVPDSALIFFDFRQETDLQYRNLLTKQYREIRDNKEEIKKTAQELHTLLMKADEELSPWDLRIKARCCNLRLLEQIYRDYHK